MSKNLKQCMGKLQLISKIKDDKLRKHVLNDMCNECLYKAIHEISLNAVKGNIPIKGKNLKKLRKNKKLIYTLAKKIKNKKKQKELVVQSGGFLPYLVPVVASILTSLITDGALR